MTSIHTFLTIFCIICALRGALANQPGYVLGSVEKQQYEYTGNLSIMYPPGPQIIEPDIQLLQVKVWEETAERIHIKIFDPNNARWEVTDVVVPHSKSAPQALAYDVAFEKSPFGISVTRKSNNQVLFNTSISDLVFEDHFIQFSTNIGDCQKNGPNIYGIGERISPYRLWLNESYVIWARCQPQVVNSNQYGSHPFHMEIRYDEGTKQSTAHGIFFLNSNAMSVRANPDGSTLQYTTIGGIIDLYIFTGPTPKDVIRQYHEIIGYPALPPYWSLGFHQSRYGFKNLQEVKDVISNYAKYSLPLDTIWMDIDYMDDHKDFTFDPVRFPLTDVNAFLASIHLNGQQFVPIVDPGIKNETGYAAYDSGLQDDIFIKDPLTNDALIGKVWPGFCAFPDWFLNKTQTWWTQQIYLWYSQVVFDGLWIDMNEICNFCNGRAECDRRIHEVPPKPQFERNSVKFNPNFPSYNPTGIQLDRSTIAMEALHDNGKLVEYNVHSLFGHMETRATKNSLESILEKRAFVLTRSSYAGTGRYGAHWLGDNYSRWSDLRYSISGVLTMQMFGIPFVGADICGFSLNTTAELCTRWMQIGTLYPFARNHNGNKEIPQEPYRFGSSHTEINQQSLQRRYMLLPYFYTLFYGAHSNGGGVWTALSTEFVNDPATFGIGEQFLIGSDLLVTPVVTEGDVQVYGYIPADTWYDFYNGNNLCKEYGKKFNPKNGCEGQWMIHMAPLIHIPIHVRGGSIIPKQIGPGLTTAEYRKSPFEITIAMSKYLDLNPQAQGSPLSLQSDSFKSTANGLLYWDDGVSLNSVDIGAYVKVAISAEIVYNANLNTDSEKVVGTGVISSSPYIGVGAIGKKIFDDNARLIKISIYGVENPLAWASLTIGNTFSNISASLDNNHVLTFTGLSLDWTKGFTINFGIGPEPNKWSPIAIVALVFGCVFTAAISFRVCWTWKQSKFPGSIGPELRGHQPLVETEDEDQGLHTSEKEGMMEDVADPDTDDQNGERLESQV